MKLKKLTKKEFMQILTTFSALTKDQFKAPAKEFIVYKANTKDGFFKLENIFTGTKATIMTCCGRVILEIKYNSTYQKVVPFEYLIENNLIMK